MQDGDMAEEGRAREALRYRAARIVRTASVPQRFLWLLLVVFLAKGMIIALVFTPYSGHDEVMHYAYLRLVAEEGRVPLIPDLGDWRETRTRESQPTFDHAPDELFKYAQKGQPKSSFTTSDWYGDWSTTVWSVTYKGEYYPSGWVYTGNHPPLFYLLLTPVYWLVQGLDIDQQIYVFRFATIPMGMLTVVFAYLTVRTIFPRDRFLAMTVPAFVAFQPQISYEASMLNNDILAIMFTSATIWMLAVGLRRRFPLWSCLLTGLFLGLAVLSKSTSVVTAVLVAIAMIFGLHWKEWRAWLAKGAVVAGVATLVVLQWVLYMMRTYGDPTALNRVSELQWWNYASGNHPTIWSMLSSQDFFWNRWRETWGDFGWRLIPLDTTLLRVILGVVLFGTAGLAVYAVRFLRTQRRLDVEDGQGRAADETMVLERWQVTAVLTMGVACVLGYYSILQFGTTFSLTQARYYFPMIVPGAILLMLGLRSWFPHSWLRYVGAAIFLGLVILNLMIYTGYVIPYWNPTV